MSLSTSNRFPSLALAAVFALAAAPASAKTPDYATAEWRLVRVFAPVAGPQRGIDVWVLEADVKAARMGRKRQRPARVLVREVVGGPWSVATNRYACKRGEVQVRRIERFMPGVAEPDVEPGGEPYAIYVDGPDEAIRRLLCEGAKTRAPVVRGRAAAFAFQDAADAEFARRQGGR